MKRRTANFSSSGNPCCCAAILKTLTVMRCRQRLQEYVAKVVTPVLEMQKKNGAVAIKFEAAYLRSLDFGPAEPLQSVQQVYAHFIKGDVPLPHDYTRLQNFLFRYIAREAGRLGLPVHIHTGGGCGTYFMLMGSNPALLESVLNDPSLRKTNFVLLHGGAGPFTKYVNYLLMKPNVYADFSEQTWLISTRRLSDSIRDLLEWYPEKVMFGTDLYPEHSGNQLGRNWLANHAIRTRSPGHRADRHDAGWPNHPRTRTGTRPYGPA